MAMFIRQDEKRSELQQRLAAELREKAKSRSLQDGELPDGVEDSRYLEGTKKTTSLAWAWIAIVILAVAAVIFIVLYANR